MKSSVIRGVNVLNCILTICRQERHPSVIEQLVQDQPEGINIDGVVVGPACEDLRCHIGDRSDPGHHMRGMYGFHAFRCSEVADFIIAEFVHEHVRRLDVTVDDISLFTEGQRCTDILSDFQHFRDGELSAAPLTIRHHIHKTCEKLHPDIEGVRFSIFPVMKILD